MSTRIDIRSAERNVVRVFAVDLDRKAAEKFGEPGDPWPLQEALGAAYLDPSHVDLLQIEDLEGVGLSGYLEQGMGVSPKDLNEARALIEGITGTVLVIGSNAFGGQEQVLTPRAPLRLVATFNEEKEPITFEKLPDGGTERAAAPEKKTPSDAAMSGRVAMMALLVIFALTGLVVWVAS